MTNEEILEGNKLIAYFDSSNKDYPGSTTFYLPEHTRDEFDDWVYEKDLRYHKDWNWLMPVTDKIEDIDMSDYHYKWTDLDGSIRSNFRHFEFDMARKSNGYSSCIWMELDLDPVEIVAGHYEKEYPTRIEAAWNTVVEFIKFYNKQKEQNDQI